MTAKQGRKPRVTLIEALEYRKSQFQAKVDEIDRTIEMVRTNPDLAHLVATADRNYIYAQRAKRQQK